MAREGPTAKTYPQPEQYARWKAHAAEMDMSVSEFIQAMVEAGLKVVQRLEVEVHPDETEHDLRNQLENREVELANAQYRVNKLEQEVDDMERAAVKEGVERHAPAPYENIVTHVQETAPGRVTRHLEALSGESIQENPNHLWEPLDDAGGED